LALDWRPAHVHPLVDDRLTVGIALEPRADWLDLAGPFFAPLSSEAFSTLDGMLELQQRVEPVGLVAITPRVAWSNVDNPFDPKSGVGADLFVRTVPFAQTPFMVVAANTRGFWSFFEDRVTLATGFRMRWGFAGDSGRCAPDDAQRCEWALMQADLLRLGGERTIRGVYENTVGVQGLLYDNTLRVTPPPGDSVAFSTRPGLFGAVANIELRFSLIRQFFIGELKPALFADLGMSTDDFDFRAPDLDNLFDDPRYAISVGAGLRYVLPVGPLAIDFAYSPYDRGPNDLPFRVHILLGYIF
jgi:outer membrane protein assembly factor BamA